MSILRLYLRWVRRARSRRERERKRVVIRAGWAGGGETQLGEKCGGRGGGTEEEERRERRCGLSWNNVEIEPAEAQRLCEMRYTYERYLLTALPKISLTQIRNQITDL